MKPPHPHKVWRFRHSRNKRGTLGREVPADERFTMKFPRTPHIPGSRGTDDDIYAPYTYDGTVIATEKLDGSNIMMNNKKFITRKGSTSNAEWTWPMRMIHQAAAKDIPDGYWLAGEFVYWRKSIAYENLPGPYVVFGAMKGNACQPWDVVCDLASAAGLPTVDVLGGPGSYMDVVAQSLNRLNGYKEGFVIRPVDGFSLPKYGDYVSKFVIDEFESVAGHDGVNGLIEGSWPPC